MENPEQNLAHVRQRDALVPTESRASHLAVTPASLEEIRRVLEKVLTSRTFQSAEGQKKFLRYAVEEKLAGRGDRIKEYSVGIEVFGRAESFDPRESSIVRSEARKLRARLAKYYETEGALDPIRIEFPKGSYAPNFHMAPPETEHPAASNRTEPAATQEAAFSVISEHVREQQAPASPPQAVEQTAIERAGRRPRYWSVLAAVLVLAAVAIYGVMRYARATSATGPGADLSSIVVIPFSNLSDDKDDSFSDGLSEELINALTRIPQLHVVGRTSAFQYKRKALDVRKIGQELNVHTVLAGSVRRYGDRLRITAELSDTSNGYSLWSESYDRQIKDTLAIQREISDAISRSLGMQLASSRAARSPEIQTPVNPEAYLEYLRGLYYWNRATGENLKLAIGHFEKAIALNPAYAQAYAGLASSYVLIPSYTNTPAMEVIPKIRDAAKKALDLDSRLTEALRAMGWALAYEYDWKAADQEFRQAVDLNHGEVATHYEYAHLLQREGRFEEALMENQIAANLDPLSARAIQGLARSYLYFRRYDQAIEEFRRAVAIDPNLGIARQGLGLAYLIKGDYEHGIAETEAARKVMENDAVTSAQLGYAYAVSGRSEEARAILKGFDERLRNGPFPALSLAHIYIGLGDKDRAFQWLAKAVEQHDVNLTLKTNPLYDPIRQDSRFGKLLQAARLDR